MFKAALQTSRLVVANIKFVVELFDRLAENFTRLTKYTTFRVYIVLFSKKKLSSLYFCHLKNNAVLLSKITMLVE